MRQWIVLFIFSAVLMSGCAWIEQARQDAALSDSTALAEGELSPQARAELYARSLQSLPWGAGAVAYPLGILGIGWFLKSMRGRRIRLQSTGTSEKPATGYLGKATGIEAIIQFVADVSAAVFEVGKDGSGFKRGWKAFLYALVGSVTFGQAAYPFVIDTVHSFLQAPPSWINGVSLTIATALGTGIVAFLEKQLANVKPIEPAIEKPA